MKKILSKIMPYWLKRLLLQYPIYYLSSDQAYKDLDKAERKIVIALAADYGNLGDIAITYAQRKFLQDNFPDRIIIELPISKTYYSLRSLKKKISSEDVITTVGGGNMGNIYEEIEEQRRFVIKKFPNNKVFSFPQTIDFSEDSQGSKSLEKTRKVYSKNRNLTIFAREEKSYMLMKKYFKNDVVLFPDIVISLDESTKQVRNDIVTLCIRKDIESSLNEGQRQELGKYFEQRGDAIIYQDTHIGDVRLSPMEGKKSLDDIWNTFRTSKLVITDRLHGMIFCAITKTPCIAINNSNGKVGGVYKKWLSDADYISMIDKFDVDIIKNEVEKLMNASLAKNDLASRKEFVKMRKLIS